MQPFRVPMSVLTDSYKAGHFEQYPAANRMVAYGEFRAPFKRDKGDTRFVFYGIRYFVETYLHHQWTAEARAQRRRHFSVLPPAHPLTRAGGGPR